ncbi:MAG: peptidase S10 [Xanthobacteraceae bacterium]|nr:peptidase S10 [Xanthobacteraceae bacterium]
MHAIRHRRCGNLLLAAAVVAWAAWGVSAPPAFAQPAHPPVTQTSEPPRAAPPGEPGGRPRAQNDNAPRLPADSVTEHTVELPGRTLRFTATAGVIPLLDAESGALQAEVAYVAYTMGAPAERPVTFLFNGGPGAASAYLDIGAVGPWRLPLDNITFSASTALAPNGETWLDFTDLVFIDPVGTGYSRIATSNENARRNFYSVDGDASALAVTIRKWIEKNGRQGAVKFLVGESYGGFRVPKVARALTGQGVGVRGLVMISPVLDFETLGNRRHDPMSWVRRLPSMAATVLEGTGPFDRERLREVEGYASGDYLHDLMKGEKDDGAIERMVPRVAACTGLEPAEVRRLAARIDNSTFQRELNRQRGRVASAYDPTVTALDPTPSAATTRYSDPVLDAMGPPLTGAMTTLYQGPLKWRVDQPYHLLNHEVNGQWSWGRGRVGPEVVDDLRNALAADRDLYVLVAHGANDLVTPYFATQMTLDQLPLYGAADRVKLSVYGGGHMFYTRDGSRRALRDDARAMYARALQRE